MVRPRLLAVPGVAKVAVFGGEARSLQIQIRPDDLIRFGVGVEDVVAATRKATAIQGAGVLDTGSLGTVESSMTKVAVSEALMRVADKCVQVMGGTGVTDKTIVETMFREIRAFRIYDGPTEVHKWSLAKKIKRDWKAANPA